MHVVKTWCVKYCHWWRIVHGSSLSETLKLLRLSLGIGTSVEVCKLLGDMPCINMLLNNWHKYTCRLCPPCIIWSVKTPDLPSALPGFNEAIEILTSSIVISDVSLLSRIIASTVSWIFRSSDGSYDTELYSVLYLLAKRSAMQPSSTSPSTEAVTVDLHPLIRLTSDQKSLVLPSTTDGVGVEVTGATLTHQWWCRRWGHYCHSNSPMMV